MNDNTPAAGPGPAKPAAPAAKRRRKPAAPAPDKPGSIMRAWEMYFVGSIVLAVALEWAPLVRTLLR